MSINTHAHREGLKAVMVLLRPDQLEQLKTRIGPRDRSRLLEALVDRFVNGDIADVVHVTTKRFKSPK